MWQELVIVAPLIAATMAARVLTFRIEPFDELLVCQFGRAREVAGDAAATGPDIVRADRLGPVITQLRLHQRENP
ncbi:hypothetical protein [Roseinatronobacter alkalisoli]|uniref:Secreted protein n=1 Tax=Roseinatronobacter alkalisoli TaxID=3028235 RepID=A0ABT5TE59_9RHOB|nr:hypothetical protein [Roseinatronobacter sp. HJB301]MDD7972995.1 hypothetical protein [Roseinatronobacter sp. HJB301]